MASQEAEEETIKMVGPEAEKEANRIVDPEAEEETTKMAAPETADSASLASAADAESAPSGTDFPRYHGYVFALACYSSFVSGLMVLSPLFTSQVPKHRCRIPSCEGDDDVGGNSTYVESFLNFTTPSVGGPEGGGWDSCRSFVPLSPPNASSYPAACSPTDFGGAASPCDRWVYDASVYASTTVTQFDAVCERSWLMLIDRSSYMVGMVLGGIVMGQTSDRYGRRVGLFASAVVLVVGTLLTVLSPRYEVVILMRVISGIGGMGLYESSFIIAMELVQTRYRTVCGILVAVPFSLGMCSYVALSNWIRSWRELLGVAVSPTLLIAFYYWCLPESVPWLLSQNRHDEAMELRAREAAFGKASKTLNNPSLVPQIDDAADRTLVRKSICSAFKSNTILKRTLILYYCWLVSGAAYFGLIGYGGTVSDNVLIDSACMILMEIPAFVLSSVLINKVGRKYWNLGMFVLAGASCVTVSAMLYAESFGRLLGVLGLMGKFGASAAFVSLYLYSGELFPTQFRASAVGSCSMSSRLGAVFATFVNSLEVLSPALPSLIFGVACLGATGLLLCLPETLGLELPQTLEDSEAIGRGAKSELGSCCRRRGSERNSRI